MMPFWGKVARLSAYLRSLLGALLALVSLTSCGWLQPTAAPPSRFAPIPLADLVLAYTPGPTPTARPQATAAPTSIPSPTPAISLPAHDLFLDPAWYQTKLIHVTDLWDGGLDGQSGMGAYQSDFDGCFYVDLTQDWQQKERTFGSNIPEGFGEEREISESILRNLTYASTLISQSRAIYINVEAYRAAGTV